MPRAILWNPLPPVTAKKPNNQTNPTASDTEAVFYLQINIFESDGLMTVALFYGESGCYLRFFLDLGGVK